MTEKMTAFLKAAENDAELIKALESADSPQTVIALAKERGFELTEEDLTAELPSGELDDEELDEVAGGRILEPAFGAGVWGLLARLLLKGRGARFGGVLQGDGKGSMTDMPLYDGVTGNKSGIVKL